MTKYGTREELQARLAELSDDLERAEKKFHRHGHRPGGTHMGYLAELRGRIESLEQQMKTVDKNLWQSMKRTWHEDMVTLRGAFERAVKYEDEEFRQGEG